MMFSCRSLVVLIIVAGLTGSVCLAQREQASSPNSLRFDQPIPVTVRKTNNSIMQAVLVEMDEKSITIVTSAQKRFTFPNKTIRSVTAADNSFNYRPEKDDPLDVIERLRQLMPARTGNGAPGTGPGNVPAGSGAAPGMTSGPAAITRPWELPPATTSPAPSAHGQMPGAGQPGNPMPTMPMPSGAHSGSMPPSMPAPYNPLAPGQQAAHGQNPGGMPGMPNAPPNQPHSQPPTMPMGPGMPGMPNMPPQMPHMPSAPQMPMASPMPTMVYSYQCGKCQQTFELPNEVQAGFRCPKCGVVWDQVTDQNGRVLSSTPAAKIGGGVGVVAVIVWIVSAIVRKSRSS